MYDDAGRVTETQRLEGVTLEVDETDPGNHILRVRMAPDQSAQSTVYSTYTVYDGQGRVARTIDASDNTTWYRYDSAGRQTHTIQVVDLNHDDVLDVTYDGDGIPTGGSEALINQTHYDGLGRAYMTTDANGRSTTTLYDPQGRVDRTVYHDGSFEADPGTPAALHKYLYASASPVGLADPSGNMPSLTELSTTQKIILKVGLNLVSAGLKTWDYVDTALTVAEFMLEAYDAYEFIDENGWEGALALSKAYLNEMLEASESFLLSAFELPSWGVWSADPDSPYVLAGRAFRISRHGPKRLAALLHEVEDRFGDTSKTIAGKVIRFKRNGWPDLSPFKHPKVAGKKSVVYVKPTGSYLEDFAKADQASGWITRPAGYTWHHSERLGILVLVKEEVHGLFHYGGCSIYRALTGHRYSWW